MSESSPPPRGTGAPQTGPAIEQKIRTRYGRVLSEAEIREFCLFEHARPGWHAWPHVGWAAGTHIIYARREFSAMNVIVANSMDELAGQADEWTASHSRWMP